MDSRDCNNGRTNLVEVVGSVRRLSTVKNLHIKGQLPRVGKE